MYKFYEWELIYQLLLYFHQLQLKLEINKGKDFTGDTIEVTAKGEPSTLTVFKVTHLLSTGLAVY